MSPLGLLAALLGGYLVALAIGFVVEAANAFEVPKKPRPIPPAELKTLVRREFERPPTFDPDEGLRHLAALITEDSSAQLG